MGALFSRVSRIMGLRPTYRSSPVRVNVKSLSDKNFMEPETSWEQERREVLESIGEALRRSSTGRAGMDACFYLLDHLDPPPVCLRTAAVPVRPANRRASGRGR